MARACWKPIYVSENNHTAIKPLIKKIIKKFKFLNYNLNLLTNCNPTLRYYYINKYLKKTQLHGLDGTSVLKPKYHDTILRFYTYARSWINLTTVPAMKRYGRWLYRWRRGIKEFKTGKGMLLQKYGEFKITRRYSGFRVRVDQKKILKLKKDIEKLEKKQLHQKRENRRLMKKAIKETRVRNKVKAARKASKRRK